MNQTRRNEKEMLKERDAEIVRINNPKNKETRQKERE
jgi:hypothetical protein